MKMKKFIVQGLLSLILSQTLHANIAKWTPIVSEDIVIFAPDSLMNPEQLKFTEQLISIFENATPVLQYAYAEHLDDGHGITAGRAGFTSATGDMLEVIQRYTKVKSEHKLKQYISELERLAEIYAENDYKLSKEGADISNLIDADEDLNLIDDWKSVAKDSIFKHIQDEIVEEWYYDPVRDIAQKIGAKLPITLLFLYDANIQLGTQGIKTIIDEISEKTPKNGGSEVAWLKEFNALRAEILLNTTVDGEKIWEETIYRVEVLDALLKDKNYYLKPCTITIEAWGDEKFSLPQE
jgi:chitosanase